MILLVNEMEIRLGTQSVNWLVKWSVIRSESMFDRPLSVRW